MDCEKARLELALYAKDSLVGDEKAEVERHLEGCGDCRAVLKEIEWAGGLLSSAAKADTASTPAPAAKRRKIVRWPALVALAASVVFAVVVVASVYRPFFDADRGKKSGEK